MTCQRMRSLDIGRRQFVGSDLGARVQSSVNSSALEEFHSEDDFIPTILGPDMGPKQVWAGGPFG